MQISIRRQMLFADLEAAACETVPELRPIKTENVGQKSALLCAKDRRCIVHGGPRIPNAVIVAGPAASDPYLPERAATCWHRSLRSANSARATKAQSVRLGPCATPWEQSG